MLTNTHFLNAFLALVTTLNYLIISPYQFKQKLEGFHSPKLKNKNKLILNYVNKNAKTKTKFPRSIHIGVSKITRSIQHIK